MSDLYLLTHAIFVWAILRCCSSSFLEGFAVEFGTLVASFGLVLVIVVVFGVDSFLLYLLGAVPLAHYLLVW